MSMFASNDASVLINDEVLDRGVRSLEFCNEDIVIESFLDDGESYTDLENAFVVNECYSIGIDCGNYCVRHNYRYVGYIIIIQVNEPVIVSFKFDKE